MTSEEFIDTKDPWWLKEVEPAKAPDGTLWRCYEVRKWAKPYVWLRNVWWWRIRPRVRSV